MPTLAGTVIKTDIIETSAKKEEGAVKKKEDLKECKKEEGAVKKKEDLKECTEDKTEQNDTEDKTEQNDTIETKRKKVKLKAK